MTLLIGIAIGAYFVLSGNIDTLKKPFYESMSKYNPNDKTSDGRALVQMWDDWQQSVSAIAYKEICPLRFDIIRYKLCR